MMFEEFKEEARLIFKNFYRLAGAVCLGLILLYLASGIYVIQANEVGVVRRFGRVLPGLVKPGIHYHLPWPVDLVNKVRIKEVLRLEAGFYPQTEQWQYGELIPYCISGDKNIIHNHFVIQYRISNPRDYLFKSIRPSLLLSELANTTIIKVVSSSPVDYLLTSGKREVELKIKDELQRKINELALGITILSVDTKAVQPPQPVVDAFQDVINAHEEMVTKIHEAENYRNKVIPQARAEAQKIIEEAKAYKFKKISLAKGTAERFEKILAKYHRAGKAVKERIYLNVMEQVLGRVKIYVLSKDKKGRPLKIKILTGPVPTSPRLPESP